MRLLSIANGFSAMLGLFTLLLGVGLAGCAGSHSKPGETSASPKATLSAKDAQLPKDPALGSLLGLAVGDALGTTHEFKLLAAPPFPQLAAGPLSTIVGEGPFRCSPGEVTDDTQLAITLARSLAEHRRLEPQDLGRRYVAWSGRAFDIGTVTRASLGLIARGTPAEEAGLAQWVASGQTASGNGSLMRTAPIGVFYAEDERARREASLAESAITHADPRCQLACAAFNAAIARAVQARATADLTEAMTAAAERELPQAADRLKEKLPGHAVRVEQALEDLRVDLAMARAGDPRLYTEDPPGLHLHGQMGFVRVAFRLAFWELRHAPTFQAALVDVVNRGGDADTNGAITGALLGARHGLDAIPAAWRTAVEHGRNRLGGAYHPRFFRSFVDRLP